MIFQIFSAVVVTFGFGIIFNIKNKNLFYTSIAGGLSWATYLFSSELGYSDGMVYFVATFVTAIFSESISRKISTPITNILIASLIPLAPGGGIYYTMYNLLDKNYDLALQKGVETFIIAGAMAMGVYAGSTIFRLYDNLRLLISKKN